METFHPLLLHLMRKKVGFLLSDSIISSEIFQISLDVFKIPSEIFQISSDVFQISSDVFQIFVGVFSVCLVSMRKMCATTTTIHGLSVQPFAHARELLSLCTLKSRLRSVKFSLRTFRLGRCKRRWLQDSAAMVGDSPKRRLAP